MFNPRLTETLSDYPFARLNQLLAGLGPPADRCVRVAVVHDERTAREGLGHLASVL